MNASLTLEGIPPEAFEYRLGNRSAVEWVIDQYQVSTDNRLKKASGTSRPTDFARNYGVRLGARPLFQRTDKRSGITSDPNREDDPESIVRLVGQVVRVSTVSGTVGRRVPQREVGMVKGLLAGFEPRLEA